MNIMKINDNIEITNEDNMQLMARHPDNYFDLAVVDPPYGIGESGGVFRARKGQNKKVFKRKEWDNETPTKDYFNELIRVSKNQIIWGGNYFTDKIPVSRCWIYWDKLMGGDFSDGELAWTSFDKVLKKFTKCNKYHGKIHPTQKPIQLYEWIFKNYAQKDFKILDTHLGSGSIAKALDKVNKLDKMNLSLVACELDKEYFEASILNIRKETELKSIFTQPKTVETYEQKAMF